MAKKIQVQCYKCRTVYAVEFNLSGQLVECAVCSTVFNVPRVVEAFGDKILKTKAKNSYFAKRAEKDKKAIGDDAPAVKKEKKMSPELEAAIKATREEPHDRKNYNKSELVTQDLKETIDTQSSINIQNVSVKKKEEREKSKKWWAFGKK